MPSQPRRARSNSRSTGSDTIVYHPPPLPSTLEQQSASYPSSSPDNVPGTPDSDHKYTNILILKSLNGTFDTKYLLVPYAPESVRLGRPVSSNNTSASGVGSAQIRQDNGNFDSRVLSRSHASLTTDPLSNKITIMDLNSSNGTFVNNRRLKANTPSNPLAIGDIIDLGTDIDNKLEHRRISALVEDISLIPLITPSSNLSNISNMGNYQQGVGPVTNDNITSPNNAYTPHFKSNSNAQRIAFEAAMFGDINGNIKLDDNILGRDTEILSAVFINSLSSATSPNIISMIKLLNTEISLENYQYNKLLSLNKILADYSLNMKDLHNNEISELITKIENTKESLNLDLSNKLDSLTAKNNEKLSILIAEIESLKKQNESLDKSEKITDLKQILDTLKIDLNNQKLKNTDLLQQIEIDSKNSERYALKNSWLLLGPVQIRLVILISVIALILGWWF